MTAQEAQNIRVAVVDDEQPFLDLLSALMPRFNYTGNFFSSPVKAYDVIAANSKLFDLIMLDVKMPEMDGITFAKKIRSHVGDLPILFMTAYASEEVQKDVIRLKRVAFVEKPFSLEPVLRDSIPSFLKG